jgi:hypothetical protein
VPAYLKIKDSVSKTFLVILEYWTTDKVQKPSDSECYTPLSEPYGIFRCNLSTKHIPNNCKISIKVSEVHVLPYYRKDPGDACSSIAA